MRSMTGYGQGIAQNEKYRVVIDIKSVNGRFLDINAKMPRQLLFAEEQIKKAISKSLVRGTVDVFVNFSSVGENSDITAKVNYDLAKQLYLQSVELGNMLNLQNNIAPKEIMRFNDVVTYEQKEIDKDSLAQLIELATAEAITKLVDARTIEGVALKNDLLQNLSNMLNSLQKVKVILPSVKEDFAEKLKARIAEALGDVTMDETKFLNEVAFFVDKSDINEEVVRLGTHLENFGKLLRETEPVGKKMEFLAQEMLREINTLGSKANNINLTNEVLVLKTENEKIKEQIRNCE